MTSRKDISQHQTTAGKADVDRSGTPHDGHADCAAPSAKMADHASQPLGALNPFAVFDEWYSDADHQAYHDL